MSWFKFGRDKKESRQESPVPESTGLPSLPLHSNYSVMVKTLPFEDLAKGESHWLVARRSGDVWNIISYTRKLDEKNNPIITRQLDGRNKNVSYAQVVCRFAEYEHTNQKDPMVAPDTTIDQYTTAHHYLIVANHDGIAINTEGKPCMSTQGEFFGGSFSEAQTKAVFEFHHNPKLKPLESKSVPQQTFEEVVAMPLFEDIAALNEVEILRKTVQLLKTSYQGQLDEIIAGTKSTMLVKGVTNPEIIDEKGSDFLYQVKEVNDLFSATNSLCDFDKNRVTQILDRMKLMYHMGNLRFFKLNVIPFYSKYSSDGEGRTSYTGMAQSSEKEVKAHIKGNLEHRVIVFMSELDKKSDTRGASREYEQIAETERGKEIFVAEKSKLQPIIQMLEQEIDRLNKLAVEQTNTERFVVKDPQTGNLRPFKPQELKS